MQQYWPEAGPSVIPPRVLYQVKGVMDPSSVPGMLWAEVSAATAAQGLQTELPGSSGAAAGNFGLKVAQKEPLAAPRGDSSEGWGRGSTGAWEGKVSPTHWEGRGLQEQQQGTNPGWIETGTRCRSVQGVKHQASPSRDRAGSVLGRDKLPSETSVTAGDAVLIWRGEGFVILAGT